MLAHTFIFYEEMKRVGGGEWVKNGDLFKYYYCGDLPICMVARLLICLISSSNASTLQIVNVQISKWIPSFPLPPKQPPPNFSKWYVGFFLLWGNIWQHPAGRRLSASLRCFWARTSFLKSSLHDVPRAPDLAIRMCAGLPKITDGV